MQAKGIDKPRHPDFDAYWYGCPERGIRAHAGLVYWASAKAANRLRRPDLSDDFLGTAVLAFNHVLYYYDPSVGPFSTLYAFSVNELIVRHFLRYESQWEHLNFFQCGRHKHRERRLKEGLPTGGVPQDKMVGKTPFDLDLSDDYNDPAFLRYDPDPADEPSGIAWETARACLTDKEFLILHAKHARKLTTRAIARETGIGRETVRQIHNLAKAKLKFELLKDRRIRREYGDD